VPGSSQETGIGTDLPYLPPIYPSWCNRPTFQIGLTRSSKEKLQNLDKVFGTQHIKTFNPSCHVSNNMERLSPFHSCKKTQLFHMVWYDGCVISLPSHDRSVYIIDMFREDRSTNFLFTKIDKYGSVKLLRTIKISVDFLLCNIKFLRHSMSSNNGKRWKWGDGFKNPDQSSQTIQQMQL